MDKNAFITLLFERAKQAGFTECEAYIGSEDEFTVNVFQGEITEYTSAASESIAFRGLYEGRMGFSSTQVYDEEAADQLIEGALEAAKLIDNEDEQFLYAGDAVYPQIECFDPALPGIPAADKIALSRAMEKDACAANELVKQTEASTVMTISSGRRIVNTMGLDVSARANSAVAYLGAVAEKDGRPSAGFSFAVCPRFADLAAKKGEIVEKSVKEAIDFLDAKSVPSGSYACVLRADVAASMLRTFFGIFSAENAQKGLSLLKGREGERIASEAVTIVDDPFLPGSYFSTSFDGEGVAAQKTSVVEKGVLNTLLHNLKTAKKQGVATTANAQRTGGTIGIAPSNFYIAKGDASLGDLLSDMGDGLLITELQGLHAGANAVSGDFSLGAKGYRVENGAATGAVEQITVAGNFFRLMESVLAVGNDLEFGMPGACLFGSPSLRVQSLSVAGE